MTNLHSGEPLGEHPTSEEIAAYLSDTLAAEEHAAVEEHLTGCRECRKDVTSARRLLRQHRPANRRLWLIPAVAAAVLATVMLVRTPGPVSPPDQPLRSQPGAGDTVARLRVLTPVDGDTVTGSPVRFAWQGQPGRLLYRFSLTEGSGREVWTGETADTTLVVPATVSLDRGRSYFWTVDALAADGRSLTTKTHRFVIRP